MIIKVAVKDDAEELLLLQKVAYQSEAELNEDYNIPPLTQTLDQYINDFDKRTILKVEENKRIIASGQAYIHNDTCFIGRLIVLPEFQGKGYGSAILDNLEKAFPKVKRYELFTGEKSVRNIQLYKRKGYSAFKEETLGKTKVIFLEKLN